MKIQISQKVFSGYKKADKEGITFNDGFMSASASRQSSSTCTHPGGNVLINHTVLSLWKHWSDHPADREIDSRRAYNLTLSTWESKQLDHQVSLLPGGICLVASC